MKRILSFETPLYGDKLIVSADDGEIHFTVEKYGTTLSVWLSPDQAKDLEDWLSVEVLEAELKRA